ncbi:hypothetical protein D9M68_814510 [compost metagenome]
MKNLIRTTFGGLSMQYYLRQLFFGSLFLLFIIWGSTQGSRPVQPGLIVFSVVLTLLYPYSRFVYERVVGFVLGDNLFFVNALVMLMVKLFTMFLCWAFAIFVAPVGLLYLYFHHRRAARED